MTFSSSGLSTVKSQHSLAFYILVVATAFIIDFALCATVFQLAIAILQVLNLVGGDVVDIG